MTRPGSAAKLPNLKEVAVARQLMATADHATKRKGKLNTWRVVLLVGLLCCFVGVGTAAGFVAGVKICRRSVNLTLPSNKWRHPYPQRRRQSGCSALAREENRVLIDIDELPEHLLMPSSPLRINIFGPIRN